MTLAAGGSAATMVVRTGYSGLVRGMDKIQFRLDCSCIRFVRAGMVDGLHNKVSGQITNLVQAGNVFGGVHFHTAAMRGSVPRQLPSDVPYFTDRTEFLQHLNIWLESPARPASPVEVISGIAGVGKTSLAIYWAHRVRDRFPDGELYLDLRGYHHRERPVLAGEALDRFLTALNVPGDRIPVDQSAKAALYRSVLYGRKMLILLDNASSVEQVRLLLPGTSTCRVVVTSRNQLTGLAIRDGAHRMSMDVLSPEDSIELLSRIAGAGAITEDPAASATLAAYCGHLPLALRIAAERLVSSPDISVADLVEELAVVRERLNILTAEGDETSAVRAVFSWSYKALSPDAARLFRLLGSIAGPDISLRAAAALFGAPEARVKHVMIELTSTHMLQKTSRRYHLHDLLRLHAVECAENDEPGDERLAAMRRLAVWYLHSIEAANQVAMPNSSRIPLWLADTAVPIPEFDSLQSVSQWWDLENANLVGMVRQASDSGDDVLTWQLTVALFAFFLIRRGNVDWISTHEVGIDAARRCGNELAQAWLLTALAVAHRGNKQHETALVELDAALVLWRKLGVRWGEAWTLRDIGTTYFESTRYLEAAEVLERALVMHVADSDTWGEATTLKFLGKVHQSSGRSARALDELRRALEIRRSHGDQRTIGSALNDLASAYLSAGEPVTAAAYAEQALAIHTDVDYWFGKAVSHELLGDARDNGGNPDEAMAHWQVAADLYAVLGDPRTKDMLERVR